MNESYIPDKGFVETFLRYDNRINRKRYLKRTLVLFCITTVTVTIAAIIMVILDVNDKVGDFILNWLGMAIASPGIFLSMRRFHDLNKPGWWALASIIPVVNVVVELYLLFAKGTVGANQYGADPLEETN